MLTDTRVKTAKPQEKQYKLADERGLHLTGYPNGSKLWQMRYRIGVRSELHHWASILKSVLPRRGRTAIRCPNSLPTESTRFRQSWL